MRNHPRSKPHHAAAAQAPEPTPEPAPPTPAPEPPTPAPQETPEPLAAPPLPYATPALMRVHRQAYRDYILAGGTPI
jgi:hypothetical protein